MKLLKQIYRREILSFFTVVFTIAICNAQTTNDKNAPTPPMGWNSYNAFGATVRESEIKANADFMAVNLKKYGWQYIVVDFCWSYPHHPKSTQSDPPQFRLKDGSYQPWISMDEYGRLLPDPNKFPSAINGKGFKELADYVHKKGLKFGIHVMRGIPRQAVWAKLPIKGANGINASMIADTTSTCSWLNQMYGIDMSKKGAQEYLNSLLELYTQWGVDFVKVDDLNDNKGKKYYGNEVEGYRNAIANSKRKIVFSTSPGFTKMDTIQKSHIANNADMWRVSGDFWDNWKQLYHAFDLANEWNSFRQNGHWPDYDMLQLGRIARRGPVGKERETAFTPEEQLTHMTLWIIGQSPLMFGGDLTVIKPATLSLITNDEALNINQNAVDARQLSRTDDKVIWVSKMKDKEIYNVALFNLTQETKEMSINFSEIGVKGKIAVRDIWKKKELGVFDSNYSVSVPSHGSVLIQIRTFLD